MIRYSIADAAEGRGLRRLSLALLAVTLGICWGCGPAPNEGEPVEGSGPTVQVSYGGQSEDVVLGGLETVDVDGAASVVLAVVVWDAFPEISLASVVVDFRSSDGFRPASSPNCEALIPIDGVTLEQGYIDASSRFLSWSDLLGWPGCLSVRDTAEIEIADQ